MSDESSPVRTLVRGFADGAVRLGWQPAPAAAPAPVPLARFLTGTLPTPRPAVDYAAAARAGLARMYMNSTLGCCVVSGLCHADDVYHGNAADNQPIYSDSQVVALYSAIGGYVPGRPGTDQGCNIPDALNYWRDRGLTAGGHRIAGWVAIDATDPDQVRLAIDLFEVVVFGMPMPDRWVSPAPYVSGFTWDVAGPPDPGLGHCVIGCGYDARGIRISTWAMTGTLTFPACAAYAGRQAGGEAYAAVSAEALGRATSRTPGGIDWSGLVTYFDLMGGSVPVPPTPTPTPPPVPVPPPTPTPPPVPVPAGDSDLALSLRAYYYACVRGLGRQVVPTLRADLSTVAGLADADRAGVLAFLDTLS